MRWMWAALTACLVLPLGMAATGIAQPARPVPAAPSELPANLFEQRFGGDFDLIDQDGRRRTRADFANRHVLLFFGYANCDSICSAALPLMAAARERLPQGHVPVDLVMITIDPKRDTVEGLKANLPKYGSDLIGLTGSPDALAAAWAAFKVEPAEVARDWRDEPIYAHGGFVFLLGTDGKVKTLLPPILTPDQMAKIISTYL